MMYKWSMKVMKRRDRLIRLVSLLLLGGLAAGPVEASFYRPHFVSVSGQWVDTQAHVVWSTSEQTGTAAFRVWRVAAGGDVLLDAAWVPAGFVVEGGTTYHVADPAMRRGDHAEYRIEELRLDGNTVFWGPWAVVFEEPVPPPESLVALPAVEDVDPADEALVAESEPEPAPALKVPVTRPDLYTVSFAAIADGLGRTVGDVAALAETAGLAMRHEDRSVPYAVDAAAERIWFYGWPVTNRYTRTNYFWIQVGPGAHIPSVPPDAIAGPPSATQYATVRFKQDLFLNPDHFLEVPDDFYFWKRFIGNHATFGQKILPVPLEGYADGDVTITLHLEGWNETDMVPDHRAEIYFNDLYLGAVTFDGKEIVTPTFVNPAANVRPSGNELKIKAILQAGHSASFFVLKHMDVSYARAYVPAAGALVASDGGHARLAADGFVDPVVLDITTPHAPVRIATSSGTIPPGHSWPVAPASCWIFRERSAMPAAVPVAGGHGAWLRSADTVSDYLIIAPRVFEVPARAHAAYRESQGLRVAVAFYDEICDQFANGLNTPEAIRSMLQYARAQWAVPPVMVLLAGWGHFDYLGAMSSAANHLPPLLGSDSITLRPADVLFADLTGDEVPNLAIGRLPVQTVAQFEQYIDKLKAYEAAGLQTAHQTASFFADNADNAGNFAESNRIMAEEAAARYTPSLSSLDTETVATMRTLISEALQAGQGVVQYTGHGSYQQLAGENLLSSANVNSMAAHPPVPVFFSLTCYIGRFDHFSVRSLGEALVLKPTGGALAVYAPSGLSWNFYTQQFGETFHRKHAAQHYDTLGPALWETRKTFGVLTGVEEAASRRTYNLLGDPALKLRGGEGGTVPGSVSTFALWRWERFSVEELGDPATSARDAVPEGEAGTNLTAYAFGGYPPRIDIAASASEGGPLQVEWIKRSSAADLVYTLKWADTLFDGEWHAVETNIEIVHGMVEGDEDMVRVVADMDVPDEVSQRFFRLDVEPR